MVLKEISKFLSSVTYLQITFYYR